MMNFQPMAVGLEPWPDFRILVVGSVVLNQNRSLTMVAPSELFEEAEIRGGIKDGFLAVIEPPAPKLDGAQNLHALAFSGYGDFR